MNTRDDLVKQSKLLSTAIKNMNEKLKRAPEDEESEDEDEDRKTTEASVVVLSPWPSVDDASGKFCDDTFLLAAIVLPDSTAITLAFALTRERLCVCV